MAELRFLFWSGLWMKLESLGVRKTQVLELHGILSTQPSIETDCLRMLTDESYEERFKEVLACKLLQIDQRMVEADIEAVDDIMLDGRVHIEGPRPLLNSSTFYQTPPQSDSINVHKSDELTQQVYDCLKDVDQLHSSNGAIVHFDKLPCDIEFKPQMKAYTADDSGIGTSVDSSAAEAAAHQSQETTLLRNTASRDISPTADTHHSC